MGQADVPASADGLREAEREAANYSKRISWIVCSPLQRAMKTAEAFSCAGDVCVKSDPLWLERFWGPYEGRLKSDRPDSGPLVGVEPWEIFQDRIARGLALLPCNGEGIVVSHSGVFRALLALGYQANFADLLVPHAQPIRLTLATEITA